MAIPYPFSILVWILISCFCLLATRYWIHRTGQTIHLTARIQNNHDTIAQKAVVDTEHDFL